MPAESAHIAASLGLGKGEGTRRATTVPITNGDIWGSSALLQLSEYLRVKNDLSTAPSSQKTVPFLSSPLKNKRQNLIMGSFYPLLLLLSLQGLFSLCSVNCFHSHSAIGPAGGGEPTMSSLYGPAALKGWGQTPLKAEGAAPRSSVQSSTLVLRSELSKTCRAQRDLCTLQQTLINPVLLLCVPAST